ncbi:ribosome hibernation-promoting factor, HPF/YfiA family [Acetobacteroides hydrogenigenes]|uniref:Putative sigma-54 modulation protein n=1 Tax=Acetobacteroides hydrogenigenes TaxID=979970 RepID=A0A4R2ECR8_9BACT|nr:ribosome-associated translation inhibitor RaiA [Acetobacteroides hydrogenigenes]TCN65707.1 putative sigma-54 modulation protein [Acetobacteroides hydrogenigenes]
MNIKIQSIKFDADKKLVDYVEAKLSKLSKYNDEITTIEVYLKLDPNHEEGNKKVEVMIPLPGNDIFVERQGKRFEEAVDLCVDPLKMSLTKSKEKAKNM